MFDTKKSTNGKPKRCSAPPISTARPTRENHPLPDKLALSLAQPIARAWLPRLARLFKDIIGEPANTNLPDLNQENP